MADSKGKRHKPVSSVGGKLVVSEQLEDKNTNEYGTLAYRAGASFGLKLRVNLMHNSATAIHSASCKYIKKLTNLSLSDKLKAQNSFKLGAITEYNKTITEISESLKRELPTPEVLNTKLEVGSVLWPREGNSRKIIGETRVFWLLEPPALLKPSLHKTKVRKTEVTLEYKCQCRWFLTEAERDDETWADHNFDSIKEAIHRRKVSVSVLKEIAKLLGYKEVYE